MKQTVKRLLCLLVSVIFAGVSAFAQVTTSSLGGRIVDENGTPVVGAAVVATHTPSGTVYGVVTNAEGRYAMNGMRAGGPYTVAISCLGYQSLTYTDVNLQLAEAAVRMIVHPAAAFFVCDNTQEFFIDKVLKKG